MKSIIALDVSGSMGGLTDKTRGVRLIQTISDEIRKQSDNIELVMFTTDIVARRKVTANILDLELDKIQFSPGGTDVQSVVNLCNELGVVNLAIITDGYFTVPDFGNIDVTCYLIKDGIFVEGCKNILTNLEDL